MRTGAALRLVYCGTCRLGGRVFDARYAVRSLIVQVAIREMFLIERRFSTPICEHRAVRGPRIRAGLNARYSRSFTPPSVRPFSTCCEFTCIQAVQLFLTEKLRRQFISNRPFVKTAHVQDDKCMGLV